MSAGCPFNIFGPCRKDECIFFMPKDLVVRFLNLSNPPCTYSGFLEEHCMIGLILFASHENLLSLSHMHDVAASYGQLMLKKWHCVPQCELSSAEARYVFYVLADRLSKILQAVSK